MERSWNADLDTVVQHFQVDTTNGLTDSQVQKNRALFGPNAIPSSPGMLEFVSSFVVADVLECC